MAYPSPVHSILFQVCLQATMSLVLALSWHVPAQITCIHYCERLGQRDVHQKFPDKAEVSEDDDMGWS
jgi:hypothetical protein